MYSILQQFNLQVINTWIKGARVHFEGKIKDFSPNNVRKNPTFPVHSVSGTPNGRLRNPGRLRLGH